MGLFDEPKAELPDYIIGLEKQTRTLLRSIRSLQHFRKHWCAPRALLDQYLEETLAQLKKLDEELKRRKRFG